MVYGEYVLEPQVRLAARLAALAGPPLTVAYLTNSGAEAIEGALKAARKYTGRSRLVAFALGFHGDTLGALSIGGNPRYRTPFAPLLPGVSVLPWNDTRALTAIDRRVAAVVIEPVQAEGGVRIADPAYLRALRARCTAVGAVLIFDEVVTGLGRTGALFAFEHSGIRPDLLVLAKALGGGLPLGAFIGPRRILGTLSRRSTTRTRDDVRRSPALVQRRARRTRRARRPRPAGARAGTGCRAGARPRTPA